MVDKAIQSEVNYLVALGLGFHNIEGTTVCLRTNVHQTMVCFVTSGEEPAMSMMRHTAGFVQFFFDENSLTHGGATYAEQPNLGRWLVTLDLAVRRLEEAVANSARGDAIDHLSTILSILKGCMGQHGVVQRQGYEVG